MADVGQFEKQLAIAVVKRFDSGESQKSIGAHFRISDERVRSLIDYDFREVMTRVCVHCSEEFSHFVWPGRRVTFDSCAWCAFREWERIQAVRRGEMA